MRYNSVKSRSIQFEVLPLKRRTDVSEGPKSASGFSANKSALSFVSPASGRTPVISLVLSCNSQMLVSAARGSRSLVLFDFVSSISSCVMPASTLQTTSSRPRCRQGGPRNAKTGPYRSRLLRDKARQLGGRGDSNPGAPQLRDGHSPVDSGLLSSGVRLISQVLFGG